jgi:outer membrane receptor protein involved in Fe transport
MTGLRRFVAERLRAAAPLRASAYVTGSAFALIAGVSQNVRAADDPLEEITVTATRQVETINSIPLSIQAITQDGIDRQGIKNSADLVRTVPGLNTAVNPVGGQQTFSIRGIVGGTGAATTSVYLDDTNLSKRGNGGVAQNNGVVVPLLYDLERVEVLKGPQGTLYGGSSEGGTVRYITPTPSLIEYSGSMRVEAADMGKRSDLSNEIGAAFGGPLVADKLGFRVSGIRRRTGGWIDSYSAYDGHLIEENANGVTEWAARAALLWQITDSFNAQLNAYHVDTKGDGGPNSQTAVYLPNQQLAPAGTTFTTQTRCITNQTRTAGLAQPNGNAAATFIPTSVAPGATGACPGNTLFVRPGVTYGPFKTGEDITLSTGRQAVLPSTADSDLFGLTLSWNLGTMQFKSITSYVADSGHSNSTGGEEWNSTTPGAGQRTTVDTARLGFPLFSPVLGLVNGNTGFFDAVNDRHGLEQEFRLASSNADLPFSWVAGAYYSHLKTNIRYRYLSDQAVTDAALRLLYGDFNGPATNTSESVARYGLVNDQGFQASLAADILDEEAAVFAEGNYWLVRDKLRMTAGVRYSKVDLDYGQLNFGQFSGRLATSNGALTTGDSSERPFTPKLGLQLQLADDKMIYATASKGFRAGGVSSQVSQTICATALANLGITAADIPPAFKADTVRSYELGGKFRLFERLQVNLAAFRIDWEDVQVTTTLSCGQGFTNNGGKARSEGGELSVLFRPVDPLQMYLNASYIDAHYVDPVTGPVGPGGTPPAASFNAGDKFNVPPFAMSAGAELSFNIASRPSYVRLDGTYQKAYFSGATFGSSGYPGNYFTGFSPSRALLNLRAGMTFGSGLDVNLFVQNLTNEDSRLKAAIGGGDGRGCTNPGQPQTIDCSNYGTYNPFVDTTYEIPRRYGLQMNYRF